MSILVNVLLIFAVMFVLWLLYRFFAPYFVRITTVFYVSGAPGTGKDVLSHKYALSRYFIALRRYRVKKFFAKLKFKFKSKKKVNGKKVVFKFESPPLFLTSLPILVKWHKKPEKRILSTQLTLDTILLQKRMPHGSVVYLSDINRMINQWSYTNSNVIDNVAEYISLFRHYTKGGYFIANSQGSFQVAKEIRGLFGKVRNNLSFKKFLCFYRIEGRTITMSEDVINTEQGDADKKNDNATYIYGFLNPFIRRYDTYAYYGRVHFMRVFKGKMFKKANTNYFISIPKSKVISKVSNKENRYVQKFGLNKRAIVFYFLGMFFVGLLLTALLKTALPLLIFMWLYALMIIDAYA